MKNIKLCIIIFILSCCQLIAQSKENVYYFPLHIQKELLKTINEVKRNSDDVFLVIDAIFDDKSIAFGVVPFEKSKKESVSYGFVKVKNSGRITYIDGKKYNIVFKSDLIYSTNYQDFMSLPISEQEKQMQSLENEEYSVYHRYQIYDYAKYIKIAF